MTLNEYLAAESLTDGQFAEKIGCDRTTVSRWRRGVTNPEKGRLRDITEATRGAVSPNDFFHSYESQAAE